MCHPWTCDFILFLFNCLCSEPLKLELRLKDSFKVISKCPTISPITWLAVFSMLQLSCSLNEVAVSFWTSQDKAWHISICFVQSMLFCVDQSLVVACVVFNLFHLITLTLFQATGSLFQSSVQILNWIPYYTKAEKDQIHQQCTDKTHILRLLHI